MGDPTKAEPRNPTYGGETAQESVDRITEPKTVDGGAKSPNLVPTGKPPTKVFPSAPGGKEYGAPIGPTILH